MADMTPEEQQRALAEIIANTGKNFSTLGPAIDKLLGPFAALVSATSSGATGMAAYNTVLDKLPGSMDKLIAVMGPAGDAFKAMAGIGMEYVKAVNIQNDELYKSYQGLSKIGAAGEANTDSLLKMAQQFGVVSDKQLPQFTQMLTQNSETLAKFGGTAAQGVKAFADISENIQRTGVQTQLLNMGMSIESINAGTAGYLKQQTLSGAAMQRAGEDQKAYTTRMASGAEDYIKQMDLMSKLTGKSAEALQKENEELLMNEKYSLHERELQQKIAKGGQEGLEAEKQLAEEKKVLNQTEGSVRKGFMAAFTGMGMQFEEGRKLYQSAPEAFNQAAKGTGVQANQILDTAKGEFKKTMDTFGGLIMAAGNTIFANVKDQRALENLKGTAEEREAAVLAQRQKQIENTDESIKVQTATIQLQRDAQKELQNMIHAGSTATSYFMLKLAEATKEQGTSRLPNAQGLKGMTDAEKDVERAKAERQKLSQGVGGPSLNPATGETEGTRRSRQLAAGITPMKPTESMIGRKATEELAELIPAVRQATSDAISDLVTEIANTAEGALKEALKNQLKDLERRRDSLRDLVFPPPPPQPRGFSENLEELGAARNQAGPSAASMRYRERVNPDVAQQLSGPTDDAKQAMTQFAGLPEKTSNEELIASNVLLEKKMDELIDISRASRSYLEKISNQAYA
jgi:predicted CopG family antitoxin